MADGRFTLKGTCPHGQDIEVEVRAELGSATEAIVPGLVFPPCDHDASEGDE